MTFSLGILIIFTVYYLTTGILCLCGTREAWRGAVMILYIVFLGLWYIIYGSILSYNKFFIISGLVLLFVILIVLISKNTVHKIAQEKEKEKEALDQYKLYYSDKGKTL